MDKITLTNSLIVGRNDQSDLKNWNCKTCAQQNRPIAAHYIQQKAKDIKCILSQYSNFIVLAFRYTDTRQNIWQDILYPYQVQDQHTCSKCKVQRAYNNMWQTIKEDVFDDLRQIQKRTKINTLYITGISLGGGLATISFIDINHQQIFQNIFITTYGAPRVGNNKWAAHFDLITLGKTRRIVVESDPIQNLPRCLTLLCTYQQTGIRVLCKEKTKECISSYQTNNYYQKTKYIAKHGYNSIVDHMQGYPKIYNHTLIE